MNATFDIKDIVTVPANYRWDDGEPLIAIPYSSLTINDLSLVAFSTNTTGLEYNGRSPMTYVSVFSTYTPNKKAIAVKRVYDFGDYYNSESNTVVSNCFEDEEICHTYIMPGLYTITMTVTEYILKGEIDPSTIQQHDQKSPNVIIPDIFWQWRNFKCDGQKNPLNKTLKWNSEYCQQIQWKQANPCLSQPICTWESTCVPEESDSTCSNPGPMIAAVDNVTIKNIKCEDSYNKNMYQTCDGCFEQPFPDIETVTTTYVKNDIIRVTERPPIAYLDVFQDSNIANRQSPYKVTLSPKNIQSGSFPIERIDWDLGDGTPIKTVYRWSDRKDDGFVYTNTYQDDYRDPRNYDLTHTYYTDPNSVTSTFYPSLTCYTSSTAASDCVKNVVGPIISYSSTTEQENEQEPNFSAVNILQNELNDNGKLLLGEVNNTAVVWRYNK